MPQGIRRPPPDRNSILNSIGLPPRGAVPEPASPKYDNQSLPGVRRNRTYSSATARLSERGEYSRERYTSSTAPRNPTRARADSYAPSRSSAVPAPADRRPPIPSFRDDRDRRVRQRDYERPSPAPRPRTPEQESEQESDHQPVVTRRDQDDEPREQVNGPLREPEPWEEFQSTAPARSRTRRPPVVERVPPSSYSSNQARRDDEPTAKPSGMLSRVLSLGGRGASQAPAPSARLTRYNTVKRDTRPIDPVAINEDQEVALAKQNLSRTAYRDYGDRPRSVYNQDDPRWIKGDFPRTQPNGNGSARPRPRADDYEHDPRRRSTAPPNRSSKAAAAAALTGAGVGAAGLAALDDEDSQDQGSSSDDMHDAPEAPAHLVGKRGSTSLTTKPQTVESSSSEEESEEEEQSSSEEESEEADESEESDEEEDDDDEEEEDEVIAPKAAPALPLVTNGSSSKNIAATNGNGTHATPKVESSASEEGEDDDDDDDDDDDEEEDSEDEDEDEEDEDEISDQTDSNEEPSPSRIADARKAAAAALGGVAAGAGAMAGSKAVQKRKQEQEQEAEAEAERAAQRQAERIAEEKRRDELRAAAEKEAQQKAARKAEKRKAKEEAAAAAAAAALAEKEAKKAAKDASRKQREKEKLDAREEKRQAKERKLRQESEARDRVIREREEAEAARLLAIRDKEREIEEKAEARRQSRRKPHGNNGPAMRESSVRPLTPYQRHYLLKALVMLQMQSEWAELEKLGALTEYGYPFSSQRAKLTRVKTVDQAEGGEFSEAARDPYSSDDMMREVENLQEPLILRHLFHVHLHTFPGLDKAPEKFWQKRIQPFFDEMAARNFSSSMERGEVSKRRLYALALTRYLGTFYARGFGVRGEGELRGPGVGEPGSERWGVGKQWGKGTVKRGLDKPIRVDAQLMQKIDGLFEGENGKLWREAGKEWFKVRRDWCGFKESIIESETGLEDAVSYLDISNIKNLPPQYRNSVEYARVHAAYLLHSLFVTAPNSDDLYKMLKGIHALAPYWGAKQLLKFANAETMISGILSLLLARPGGAKSLIQRIFSYVVGKEASYIQKEFVVPLRKEIDDVELTRKVEEYVKRGDRIEGRRLREKAIKRGEDVLTTILLEPTEPRLSKEAQDHVLELQRCFALSPYRGDLALAYPETTPFGADKPPMPAWGAHGAESGRARKFALLKLLLRESLKRRDREQAVEFASGSLIPAIIKDALQTVFYPAIRQIAATADLSERLGDLQKFIDDLLETKKRKDDSFDAWIALAARHQQSLYFLFHECASISKPLWEWCQLGLDYMALSTTDPEHPADRSAANVEINFEELLQDARLTDGDVKKILGEADRLARFTKWGKVRYELDMRKNYLLARPEAAGPGGLCSEQVRDERMRREIQDTDGLMRELMEMEGEPIDDGLCEDGVRGTEKHDFAWAFFDAVDPLNQDLRGEQERGELRIREPVVSAPLPSLKHTRKLLPLFCELLASKLPEWQSEDVLGALGRTQGKQQPQSLFKQKKNKTASAGFNQPSASFAETRSVMSSTSRLSKMRLPSLFGRK